MSNMSNLSVAVMRDMMDEVRQVKEAWPNARELMPLDDVFGTTVMLIEDPLSTYIIEIKGTEDGVKTRSLWISHRAPIGPDPKHAPQWIEGWVD